MEEYKFKHTNMNIKDALANARKQLGGTHEERVAKNILAQVDAILTPNEVPEERKYIVKEMMGKDYQNYFSS
jgi:hypothetical protein